MILFICSSKLSFLRNIAELERGQYFDCFLLRRRRNDMNLGALGPFLLCPSLWLVYFKTVLCSLVGEETASSLSEVEVSAGFTS